MTIQKPSYQSNLPQLTQKVSQIVAEHNDLSRHVHGLYLVPQENVSVTPFDIPIQTNIIPVDTSTIAITLNLPPVNAMIYRRLIIVDATGNANAHHITIQAFGSEEINDANTRVMNTKHEAITLWNNGIKWLII